jgi:exonuclease VII small subunit
MTNPLEKYLSALDRFNQSVAELTAKYEQANQAREDALQASAELRRELEATDQRVQDIAVVLQQQVVMDFRAIAPHSASITSMPAYSRVS